MDPQAREGDYSYFERRCFGGAFLIPSRCVQPAPFAQIEIDPEHDESGKYQDSKQHREEFAPKPPLRVSDTTDLRIVWQVMNRDFVPNSYLIKPGGSDTRASHVVELASPYHEGVLDLSVGLLSPCNTFSRDT